VLGSTRREQMFGGRPAVGQVISIGEDRYTVVGVMERKEFYWNSANRNALEWMNEMMFVPVTSVITRMVGDRREPEGGLHQRPGPGRQGHGQGHGRGEGHPPPRPRRVVDFQVFNRAAFMQQMDEQGKIYDITFLTCGTISLLVGGS